MTKRLRDLCREVEGWGFEIVEMGMTGSCHVRFKLKRGDKVRTTHFGYSPGDRRALLNWKADIRRDFIAAGAKF